MLRKLLDDVGPGRLILTATSVLTGVGAYVADWNKTHIYNPEWPPHAKFHNGQTMSMGAALGATGLYFLWGTRAYSESALRNATGAASIYWLTQASAILYPGTAYVDPPSTRKGPQPVIIAVTLALNALGYGLERRRLRRLRG